ncbi:MAG: PASTA domain-containing protein [bacterium]|nr:PASTA domain-containing protein [bacterium]
MSKQRRDSDKSSSKETTVLDVRAVAEEKRRNEEKQAGAKTVRVIPAPNAPNAEPRQLRVIPEPRMAAQPERKIAADREPEAAASASSEGESPKAKPEGRKAEADTKRADGKKEKPQPASCSDEKSQKKRPILSVLKFGGKTLCFLIVLFLSVMTITLGIIAGATVYRTYFAIPEEIEVPVIQGKDIHEVNRLLTNMGLRLRLEEGKYSNKFPEQIIISQDPAPGKTVRQDREVLAVVSLGPELMTVPDLSGKSLRDVDIILADNKLTLGKVKEVDKAGVKTIEVVSQKPKAGSRVRPGTPINVDVNRGVAVAGVIVPDWRGKNIAAAKALIAKSGLKLGRISWSPSTSVQQGFVVQHNPPYGAEVAAGSEVELEVSAGAASARMLVQRQLDLILPKGSQKHDVRIVLVSGSGEEEVYHAKQVVGDHLYVWVSGASGSDIEIYINGNMVKRDRL